MRTVSLAVVASLLGILAVLAQDRPPVKVETASAGPVEFLPRPTEAEKQVQEALETVVDASFAEVPIGEAVSKLSADHKVNVVLDLGALKTLNVQQPVTVNLDVQKIKLRSVLNLVCRESGLAWIVEDEVIKVTTAQAADSRLVTRTYPVADLVSTPDDLKSLKTAVEKTGTAAGWDVLGGEASAVTLDSARSLIVTQSWSGHQQVLNLLRMLREAKGLTEAAGTP
jgi:hypothetical protein